MIIDLSEIIKDYGGKMNISAPVQMNDTEFLGESFVFEKPLELNGTITNNTKSLEFSAKAEGEVRVHCARCNKPMTVPVKFRIHEILASEESEIEDEDTVVFSGEKIDVADIVLNSFLMSVPGKYLCKEDCRGLCLKCGADLNEGDCNCDHEEIDPRWAGLQEIMKNMADTE